MSQILRIAGRLTLTSVKKSDRPLFCEYCDILRNGYSTQSQTKLQTYLRSRTRKWKKKKLMSDREALHDQLTRTLEVRFAQLSISRALDARLVQLSSSQGARTQHLDPFVPGEHFKDIYSDLLKLSHDIELLSHKKNKNDSKKVNETRDKRISEKHFPQNSSSGGSDAHQAARIQSTSQQSNDIKQSILNSEYSDSVQKQYFESEKSGINVRTSIESGSSISVIAGDKQQQSGKNISAKYKQHCSNREGKMDIETKSDDSTYVNQLLENAYNKQVSPQKQVQDIEKKSKTKRAKSKARLNELFERKNKDIEEKKSSLKTEVDLLSTLTYPYNIIHSSSPNIQYAPKDKFRVNIDSAKEYFKYKPESSSPSEMGLLEGRESELSEDFLEHEQSDAHDLFELGHEIDAEEDKLLEVMKSIKYPKAPNKLYNQAELKEMGEINVFEPVYEETPDNFDFFDKTFLDHDSGSIEGTITNKAKKKMELKHKQELMIIGNDAYEKIKVEGFNKELKAYVDACVATGMGMRAMRTVTYYRNCRDSPKFKTHERITDINIYNNLMRGLVKEGKGIKELKEVFSFIREDGLEPNLQSYSICLAGIGLRSDYDLMIATFIVKDMKKKGLDINDIFNQCTFQHNERHAVFKMLKQVIPNFEPNPPNITSRYEGPLVESLNAPAPLSEVVELNPYAGALSRDEVLKKAEVQFGRELDGHLTVESIFEPANEEAVKDVRERWRLKMKEAFKEKKIALKREAIDKSTMNMYPFLCLFSTNEYVDIMCKEVEMLAMVSNFYSSAIHNLHSNIAKAVFQKYMIQQMSSMYIFPKLYKVYKGYIDRMMDPNLPMHNQRECWNRLVHHMSDGNSMELHETIWPRNIQKKVGEILYDIILTNVDIDVNMFKKTDYRRYAKCFYPVQRSNNSGELFTEVKPHVILCKLMTAQVDLTFPTADLPMLCPPVPFISPTYGGNFVNTVDSIRMHCEAQDDLLLKTQDASRPVFDALNILGACPWRVNKPVFEVVLKLFKEGGHQDVTIPLLPSLLKKPVKPKGSDVSKEEIKKYYKDYTEYSKTFGEASSLWWTDLYKLSIANKFRNDVFWFPTNMDFRSRTYPVPPHLNHQGNDVSRGIMEFAKGKALGEKGLDWLKIHLVNLTGFKKRCATSDRLAYAEEMMPDILDSAHKPLTGNKWWMTSDEPWQTLAVCMEVAAAVRSGDPTKYISHCPVHQDGSCNGLQHYAALGRDEAGAKSVNLYPFEVPSDVYSEVVEKVRIEIEKDKKGNTRDAKVAAKAELYLERKVIKQPIMTTVYGVTYYGAKAQVAKRLKDKDIPIKDLSLVSIYLVTKTLQCLREMFVSARSIQEWFDICANTISSDSQQPVEWITPLNFPVVQPYFKYGEYIKKKGTEKLPQAQFDTLEPNKLKQRNGFAPNFIHSLDSTHMFLTALHCYRKGIMFTSVHDCFWTHAADVGDMNKITREQFVALHSEPILENLSYYFIKRFIDRDHMSQADIKKLGKTFTAIPDKGKFELENVLKSEYFFS